MEASAIENDHAVRMAIADHIRALQRFCEDAICILRQIGDSMPSSSIFMVNIFISVCCLP